TEIFLKGAMSSILMGKLDYYDYNNEVLPFIKTLYNQSRNTDANWEQMITSMYVGLQNGDLGGLIKIRLKEDDTVNTLYEFHKWQPLNGIDIVYSKILDENTLEVSNEPTLSMPYEDSK